MKLFNALRINGIIAMMMAMRASMNKLFSSNQISWCGGNYIDTVHRLMMMVILVVLLGMMMLLVLLLVRVLCQKLMIVIPISAQ